MRIEVIETLSSYEKKRWEFVCVLDSRGLHIRLAGMKLEQRAIGDKRSIFKTVLEWSDTPAIYQKIPATIRMHNAPKVPLTVQRRMRHHLEATIHYNFDVCMADAMQEAPSHAQH